MAGILFTDGSIERRCELRGDGAGIDALMRSAEARFLQMRKGRVRMTGQVLAWLGWEEARGLVEAGAETVFLGMHGRGGAFAVIPAETPQSIEVRIRGVDAEEDFIGLFQAAALLESAEALLAGQAVHLANWINRSRYCGRCGRPMAACDGGHRRQCSDGGCGWQEFPRTDPVILALVVAGDRCLLARQPRFPPDFYSALAGFVEPAETIEGAVRREVMEEVGIAVGQVTYVASQPWPFPNSLMLGFIAEAMSETIVLDRAELEDAIWLDRGDMLILADGGSLNGRSLLLPPSNVLARQVIDHWLIKRR